MPFNRLIIYQRGFTLIELLIAICISTFVFTAVFSLFKEGLLSYDRSVNEADIQLEVKYTHDVIKRDVMNSKVGNLEGKSYPINENGQKLILYTGTEITPAYITYYIENSNLLKVETDGTTKLLMENVSGFNINVTENNLVKISITKKIHSPYSNQAIEKQFYVQAKPRSKIV